MFNHLDPDNLAKSIEHKLRCSSKLFLTEVDKFSGPGVYVLTWCGVYPLYDLFSLEVIYVGKAQEAGARTGKPSKNNPLYNRLRKHRRSVEQADNLLMDDIEVQYLVLPQMFVDFAETALIKEYQPLWNIVLPGFGNNDPGKGRRGQAPSAWDIIHPGRGWVSEHPVPESTEHSLRDKVLAHARKIGR